jgi:hypothetical protein
MPPNCGHKTLPFRSLQAKRHYTDQLYEYRPKNPPPLLLACVESCREQLRAYNLSVPRNIANGVASTKCIRYDYDIVHIKGLGFTSRDSGYQRPWFGHIRPDPGVGNWAESDRWIGRPQCFEHIETVAISRNLLVTAKDEYQCIIRHFSQKLRVLIVLIDDEFDIGEVWKPRDEYQSYEDGRLDDDDYTLYEDKKYV